MGRGHLLAAQATPDVDVCAVCDASQAALDAVTDPGIHKHTDWLELLHQEDLDLVIVCLPHHLYAPVVTAALSRGFHVYKDKPFARDLADARQMVAAARAHGRRIFVGAQRKFSPEFQRAKEIVDSGVLGSIHFVRGAIHYYWTQVFNDTMGWRGRKEESGGIAIIDSGYHILDAVLTFHGKPATVFASTGRLRAVKDGTYTIDDKAALVLNWSYGGLGSLTVSFATVPGEFRVVLHGQEGTLDISDSHMDLYRGNERVEQIAANDAGVNLLEAQFAHCVEALRTGNPSLCDMDRALDVQAVITAAYQSDASGQVVAVE